ncbi:MAG: SUMF1/EgtB/PvdO family nonheme iron enzyme [Candidatus Omnitrophota bacterium]
MKKNGIIWWVALSIMLIITLACSRANKKGVQKLNKLDPGKRIAICIGINEYEDNTISKLKNARNDALELAKVLKENGQFETVYVMTDDLDAKKEDYPKLMNIKRKMDFLKGFIKPQDLVIFSFSGHGISNSQNEGFLLAADSYHNNLYESSLKVSNIVKWLKETGVKKSLLLLDACRENVIEGMALNLNMMPGERFSQAEVGAVCYATKSGWFSYEDSDLGVFSKYVIEGLGGKADNEVSGNRDGIVSFSELSAYIEEEVSRWALKESKQQKPYTQLLGEKFGDIALSAYAKTEEARVEIQNDKQKDTKVGKIVTKKEEGNNVQLPNDKPAEVKAMESKTLRVYKNDKGYWEADFGDGILMVYIPAGEFIMGSDDKDKDAYSDEKPSHKIYLDGYWLGKTEVTVSQFRTFLNKTEYVTEAEQGDGAYSWNGIRYEKYKIDWKYPGFEQKENYPVVCVSWNDAKEYCNWLSKKVGVSFTLPTEAQWEKGARGTDGRKYPWGNHAPYANGTWYANYGEVDREKRKEGGFEKTSPVGFYPQGASPYGLMDMAGNVWEWCSDWYKYYPLMPLKKNPTGPVAGDLRVLRSGSWFRDARSVRSAMRLRDDPGYRHDSVGFRLSIGQQGGSDSVGK